jgi:hypothetical protein
MTRGRRVAERAVDDDGDIDKQRRVIMIAPY